MHSASVGLDIAPPPSMTEFSEPRRRLLAYPRKSVRIREPWHKSIPELILALFFYHNKLRYLPMRKRGGRGIGRPKEPLTTWVTRLNASVYWVVGEPMPNP
jgi:hypothetical protein